MNNYIQINLTGFLYLLQQYLGTLHFFLQIQLHLVSRISNNMYINQHIQNSFPNILFIKRINKIFSCVFFFLMFFSFGFAQQKSQTFIYKGYSEAFFVPDTVTILHVDVIGASGGRAHRVDKGQFGHAGWGGRVQTNIAVTPGQKIIITVGGIGMDATLEELGNGGFNGGASGGVFIGKYTSGGGGGASDIRTGFGTLRDRIIVAGGGGGAGYFGAGGNGGDLTGDDGYGDGKCAGGGRQEMGGNAGNYKDIFTSAMGAFGYGGYSTKTKEGGGGGAGWYGGGGGAFGDGGGGSSHSFADATNTIHTKGYNEGDGLIIFSWE